jgi:integrase
VKRETEGSSARRSRAAPEDEEELTMASRHVPGVRQVKSGRWEARYRDSAGRQRTYTADTRADAIAFLNAARTDVARGVWRDPALARTLFGELADRVEATRVNRRASTRARDARLMKTQVLPTFRDCPLGDVTATDVKAWVASLEAAGLAPSTIRKCYQLLARVFDEATETGLIGASPCHRIPLPTDERPEPALLTPQDVERLADVIDDRYRALVLTAAYTGLRWGELAGLRVPRVDFLRRRIDVAEILVEVDGAMTFGPPKTKTSRAFVSFPAFLADELGAHVAAYPDPERRRRLLFVSDEGTPLRRSNFRRRVWIPAAVEAGVGAMVKDPATRRERYEGATFHDLRHACASWLIHAGANPLEVAAKLRHARVTTTLATYGHLFPGTDERLDGLLEGMRDLATAQ